MQTKNMRFLKASVLCLSVFLLKQTGHAVGGYLHDLENDLSDDIYYAGSQPKVSDQDIEWHSKQMANLQLDWLLPLDPKQAKDRKLAQQRDAHRKEFIGAFPFALNTLSSSHDVQPLKDFQGTLRAIASGKPCSAKDVGDRDVRGALEKLVENAPDVNYRLAKLVLRKVAFGCSEVVKTIKKAPDATQAGFMKHALKKLQQSGVLQDPAVRPFANELQGLFQQASAAAGTKPSRKPQSRPSGVARRQPTSSSAGGAASLAAQGLASASGRSPFSFSQAPRQSQTAPAFPPASSSAGGAASQAAPGGSSFGFGQTAQWSDTSVRPRTRQPLPPKPSSSSSDEEEAYGEGSYVLNDQGQPVSSKMWTQKNAWDFSHHAELDVEQPVHFDSEDEEAFSNSFASRPPASRRDFQSFDSEDETAFFNPFASRPPEPRTRFEDRNLEDHGAEPLSQGHLSRTPSVMRRNKRSEQYYQQAQFDLQKLASLPVSEKVMRDVVKTAQNVLPSLLEDEKAGVQEWIDSIQKGLNNGQYAQNAEAAVNEFGGVNDLMKALGLEVLADDDRRSSSSGSSSSSDSESDSGSDKTVVGKPSRKSGSKSS